MEHLTELVSIADRLGSPWAEILSFGVAAVFCAATAYGYVSRVGASSRQPPTVPSVIDLTEVVTLLASIDRRLREIDDGQGRVVDSTLRVHDAVERAGDRISRSVSPAR